MSNSIEELIDGMPITSSEPLTMTLGGINKAPMNIIVNGFSIKDTILEVLRKYHIAGWFTRDNELNMYFLSEIAEDIEKEFAIKLGLKQGKE